MITANRSHLPPSFVLLGVPGKEEVYGIISVPFSLMFLISMVGNGLVICVIMKDPRLHQPMYMFLSMLSTADLFFSITSCSSVLRIFWLNSPHIRSDMCLVQMYFIHSFSVIASGLLLAMAFDRFVAICNPLRYTSILRNSAVVKISVASVIRSLVIHVPSVSSLHFLPYCKGILLSHAYCLHQDVMKLACEGTNTFNIVYGLVIISCTFSLDALLIFISYLQIIRTVFGLTSGLDRYKMFNTCISHLCAVFIFYVPVIVLAVIHRLGTDISPDLKTFVASVYILVAPMLNPIIYSIKTKQIRQALGRIFHQKRIITQNLQEPTSKCIKMTS